MQFDEFLCIFWLGFVLKHLKQFFFSYIQIMIITTRLPWGTIAFGEMFDNMLQLMRFSVYFKGILNTDNGYFHI